MQIIPLNLDSVLLSLHSSKVAYLPVGAASLLFTGTKNKEKKSCFTTDGIVLAELLKSVGLDISFDANTSSSPPAACKKCARKIVNCSTLFHELKRILIAKKTQAFHNLQNGYMEIVLQAALHQIKRRRRIFLKNRKRKNKGNQRFERENPYLN